MRAERIDDDKYDSDEGSVFISFEFLQSHKVVLRGENVVRRKNVVRSFNMISNEAKMRKMYLNTDILLDKG